MFAAFHKVVLCNVAFTTYQDFGWQQKWEVLFDFETPFEPFITDNYFEQYNNRQSLSCKDKR